MRAHTITTMRRPRRNSWCRALALALGVCALAIPASASGASEYSSVNAITGGSSDSNRPAGVADHAPLNAIAHPPEPSGSGESQSVGPGTSSLNATVGPPPSTSGSASPIGSADGFHWGDAALGAGAAMALVALGGAVFLTVRRPKPVPASPTSTH
jgi:hypothetical protein